MSCESTINKNTGSIAFGILFALSLSHCTNDMLQSVIMAVYPLIKDELVLNFRFIRHFE